MNQRFYWVMIFVTIVSASKITLEELAKMEVGQLQKGQMVEVVHSSKVDLDAPTFDPLKRQYYIMRSTHKDKRFAYTLMNQMISKVVVVLKKFKVIPHQRSLVKSKIKPQYMSKKRKWAFSTMFVVLGRPSQLKKVQGYFLRMGIHKLNAQPSINFLNEKVRALELFAKAKAQLDNELKRFPNFEISQIQEIEIEGFHMPNSDIIENQIQEEFSDSEENMEQSQIKTSPEEVNQEDLTVRIVFKVTEGGVEDDSVQFEEDEDEDNDTNDTDDDTEQVSF